MTAPVDFLLVETRAGDAGRGLAADGAVLAASGQSVVLLYIEDGVTLAVGPAGIDAAEYGVWVDGYSLAQRNLRPNDLWPGVRVVEMDVIVDALLSPRTKVMWR